MPPCLDSYPSRQQQQPIPTVAKRDNALHTHNRREAPKRRGRPESVQRHAQRKEGKKDRTEPGNPRIKPSQVFLCSKSALHSTLYCIGRTMLHPVHSGKRKRMRGPPPLPRLGKRMAKALTLLAVVLLAEGSFASNSKLVIDASASALEMDLPYHRDAGIDDRMEDSLLTLTPEGVETETETETMAMVDHHEDQDEDKDSYDDNDNDKDKDKDKDSYELEHWVYDADAPDVHDVVLLWLSNRAHHAEEKNYVEAWRKHNDEDPGDFELRAKLDDYRFQNGYYFSHRYLRLDKASGSSNNTTNSSSNSSSNTTDNAHSTAPRLVAKQSIPEGELLVSVPSNAFLFKRKKPAFRQLHPCDVAAKVLDPRTYAYPESEEKDRPGVRPSLEKFVRPFVDSILALQDGKQPEDGQGQRQRQKHGSRWSTEQLNVLSSVLGNELEPKPNTLGLWGPDSSGSEEQVCADPASPGNGKGPDPVFSYPDPSTFRSTLETVLERGWNGRMVPIYHWIPRASDPETFNVVHSEVLVDDEAYTKLKVLRRKEESDEYDTDYDARAYQLRASRTIRAGEAIVLPFHSVAQRFATTGQVHVAGEGTSDSKTERRDETDRGADASYRFWAQTMHDQEGHDLVYVELQDSLDPYEDHLVWDYYPSTQRIEWVHKSWGANRTLLGEDDETEDGDNDNDNDNDNGANPRDSGEALRFTQRAVLQAQYLRLRGLEPELKAALLGDEGKNRTAFATGGASGNAEIYEYYELWMESLGVLLSHSRPARAAGAPTAALAAGDAGTCPDADGSNGSEPSCPSERAGASKGRSAYDDLGVRADDPIDYNGAIASHECTNLFAQYTYETSKTFYAELEWTRSYIGGGSIRGRHHQENRDQEQEPPKREQDTCLHLNNILHSCLAFRPHVHEILIHYPASFLPRDGLKRVLYVGGGDLVLLHELLRYESIELVIGMELDQMVLRDSFRHYGIQPKFEDERVHWWFGDAAKSLSLLPPEEFFGTFDLVLIDLVVEIFDALRVGDQNERLVDYMAKLLKPEGILVRQEDYPHHSVVDFARYTVDLNVFGMPHTCSQYFTMASDTIDFANHQRVDHGLEGLVWYEPNVGSNDHFSMWGNYRNNLVPPNRICDQTVNTDPVHVLPSKGIFVAIEAENVTLALDDASLVQTTAKKALEEIGFTGIRIHGISTGSSSSSSTSSMVLSFEEGYLGLRSYPANRYCSMDLQLWNDISNHKLAVSKLVEAVGGTTTGDSTSSFLITTGGMLGLSNFQQPQDRIVPSSWCDGDGLSESSSKSSEGNEMDGIETVIQNILARITGKKGSVVFLLCPNKSSRCRVREDVDYGSAEVVSFEACPATTEPNDASLSECEEQMVQRIQDSFLSRNSQNKIEAIVMDPRAPRELGQITKKVFVTDPRSYRWLSHDYVVLAPSTVESRLEDFWSSWKYQLLERFRTDHVEFNPLYHATAAFRDPSSSDVWTMGVLSAGNPRFYDQLVSSFQAIRGEISREVLLVETKTGAISHIPDYQPSKWATPSDYDLEPAELQWSDQRPLGGQAMLQYEGVPQVPDDNIDPGTTVLFHRIEDHDWCVGKVVEMVDEGYVVSNGVDYPEVVERKDVLVYDKEAILAGETIPFGSFVVADGEEHLDLELFYEGQINGVHHDGRYKVYFLSDGTSALLDPSRVVLKPIPSFSSPAEVKLFSSCSEFFDFVFGSQQSDFSVFPEGSGPNPEIYRRSVGNGCLVVVSQDHEDGSGAPTTIVATYDGQIHVTFNVFQSMEEVGSGQLLNHIANLNIPGMELKQNDSHPRGYGRVVNFREDMDKAYFGTEYPVALLLDDDDDEEEDEDEDEEEY